jgi:hypothetical protein
MIIVSVKAPAPPPTPPAELEKCLEDLEKCQLDLQACQALIKPGYPVVPWEIRPQVTTPEVQRVVDYPKYQVAVPENQSVNDIRFVLEYTIS